MSKIEIQDNGCWIWKRHIGTHGYGVFFLNGRHYNCHRLILEEKLGRPVYKHLVARHLCGVRACCCPDHIVESTQKENMADMKIHGTAQNGEKHWNAKLTDDEIRLIRQDFRPQRKIAKAYGVCQKTVSYIKNHLDWNHII